MQLSLLWILHSTFLEKEKERNIYVSNIKLFCKNLDSLSSSSLAMRLVILHSVLPISKELLTYKYWPLSHKCNVIFFHFSNPFVKMLTSDMRCRIMGDGYGIFW